LNPAIHPSIEYVLSCVPRSIAANAEMAIRSCLASRLERDGYAAFGGSRLTGDGFPVEFAVATRQEALRITIEPGPRGLAARQRTRAALNLVAALNRSALDGKMQAMLNGTQIRGPLDYGAWIGLRAAPGKKVAAKLYAELPGAIDPPSVAGLVPQLPDRPVVPRMLGFSGGQETAELYLRLPSLMPCELRAILAPVGLEGEADALLDSLSRTYGYSLRGRLPGSSVGVSYVSAPKGRSVTLFFYARALWGSDARIRRRFARVMEGSPLKDTYLAATEPFACREEWRTYHGLLAITPEAGKEPRVALGFRPVAPS